LSCGAHNKLTFRLPAELALEFELQNEEKIVKKCAYTVTTEDIRESIQEDQQEIKVEKTTNI
jgi:hypothetical protein